MVLVLTALAACSSGKGKPLESGDITKENVLQVCEILNEAGLSNVDVESFGIVWLYRCRLSYDSHAACR